MKKTFIRFAVSVLILVSIVSCEKEVVDPTLPPVIEVSSGLDAENKVNLLMNEGKNIDFLIDLQDDNTWRACYKSDNYDIVYAYGITARIILSVKQKKVEKKLRNVVTVYTIRRNIFGDRDYMVNIYNNQKVRFYKVNTNFSRKSPMCTGLGYFFSSAEPYGGVFLK